MPEIMESIGMFRKKLNMIERKFGNNEREKKIDAVLLSLTVSTKEELHGVSALTYNDQECDMVMARVIDQLDTKKNSWKEILKVRVSRT